MSSPYLGIQHIAAAQNQPEVTANGAIDSLDTSENAEASFALTDASTAITLTQAQMASGFVLKLTGTLTAARNVIVPAIARNFVVYNASAGGFGVTVKTSGGSGILVPSGLYVTLFCDGTNVVQLSGGSGGGVIAATPVENEVVSFSGTAGTLANTPSAVSGYTQVKLYRDGQRLNPVGGNDFTWSGAAITLVVAAIPANQFLADYWR